MSTQYTVVNVTVEIYKDDLFEGEEVLATQMQPVQLGDFDWSLGRYLGSQGPPSLALLLDYDGTLSPLASHPDLATIPPVTKQILTRSGHFISSMGRGTIIS